MNFSELNPSSHPMPMGNSSNKAGAGDRILFFLHIPKCAGTSLIDTLSKVGRQSYLVISKSPTSKLAALNELKRQLSWRWWNRRKIRLVMGHDVFCGMDQAFQRPAFYFSFLRDPVERYISHYRYLVDCAENARHPLHSFATEIVNRSGQPISLQSFVEQRRLCNFMTNHLASAMHPDLSTKRWDIVDGKELRRLAEACLRKLAFIGFVDSFEQDSQYLCQVLGIDYIPQKSNPSLSRIDHQLDETLIELIRDRHRLDLWLYQLAKKIRAEQAPE
jgi:Sulfotransferase family